MNTAVLVHSTSSSSPTHFKEKNLTKAVHYQEKRRHLPNQTKHVVATSDLLPVWAGAFLWHDPALCKNAWSVLRVRSPLLLDTEQKQPTALDGRDHASASTLLCPSPIAKLNCFLSEEKKKSWRISDQVWYWADNWFVLICTLSRERQSQRGKQQPLLLTALSCSRWTAAKRHHKTSGKQELAHYQSKERDRRIEHSSPWQGWQ